MTPKTLRIKNKKKVSSNSSFCTLSSLYPCYIFRSVNRWTQDCFYHHTWQAHTRRAQNLITKVVSLSTVQHCLLFKILIQLSQLKQVRPALQSTRNSFLYTQNVLHGSGHKTVILLGSVDFGNHLKQESDHVRFLLIWENKCCMP